MSVTAVLAALTSHRATRTERGAGLVEYLLLVSLIAVVCLVAVSVLGGSVASLFDGVGF